MVRFRVAFSGLVKNSISKTLAQAVSTLQEQSHNLLLLFTLRAHGKKIIRGLKIRVSSVRSRPLPPPFYPNEIAVLLGFFDFLGCRWLAPVFLVALSCAIVLIENH